MVLQLPSRSEQLFEQWDHPYHPPIEQPFDHPRRSPSINIVSNSGNRVKMGPLNPGWASVRHYSNHPKVHSRRSEAYRGGVAIPTTIQMAPGAAAAFFRTAKVFVAVLRALAELSIATALGLGLIANVRSNMSSACSKSLGGWRFVSKQRFPVALLAANVGSTSGFGEG